MSRKRRSDEATKRRRGPHASRRTPHGFSLPEVLISIFILAIGLISIAALFPAGIAQQRQSVDDIMGPIVANNAIAILRAKVRPQDFGYLTLTPSPTIAGDFGWSRPAYFLKDTAVFGNPAPAGSISIFSGALASDMSDTEVIWKPSVNTGAPAIIITQNERYYPMVSLGSTAGTTPRPQYVWDCMFRRFQGKVLVAIFVYRAALPGGGAATYSVAANPPPNTDVPPLPIHIDLLGAGTAWDADANLSTTQIEPYSVIPNTDPGTSYDPSDHAQAWQMPGQWILDQNNNVHRVLNGRRQQSDGPVELLRPVPVMLDIPAYFLDPANPGVANAVTNIWYIPPIDANGISLTPVFVSVKEL